MGVFSRDKACPASFSHLCNLPFPSFQPRSRSLHALSAPPHLFLPSHLIYGGYGIYDGYGITGGCLSWGERSEVLALSPKREWPGEWQRVQISSYPDGRCRYCIFACMCVCSVGWCVGVCVLVKGGRDTLTGAGTALSFLSNSSTAAHLLSGACVP